MYVLLMGPVGMTFVIHNLLFNGEARFHKACVPPTGDFETDTSPPELGHKCNVIIIEGPVTVFRVIIGTHEIEQRVITYSSWAIYALTPRRKLRIINR